MKKITLVLALAVAALSVLLAALPFALPLTGDPQADTVSAVGRFHIVVLHLPIGIFAAVPLFELLGWLPRLRALRAVPTWLMALAAAAAYKTCVLGYLLAWGEGAAGEGLDNHLWGGIATAVVMMAAFVARFAFTATPKATTYALYLLLLGGSGAALTWGAHQGASLVHGEAYLYERLPEDVQRRLGVYVEPPPPLSFASQAYPALIQPVLSQKCYGCHSEQKERGGFRMDQWDRLLAGGKSGTPGLVPGDPAASGIIIRTALNPAHKEFMPPEPEPALTADESALLAWWIAGGASDTQTLAELSDVSLPEDVEAALARVIEPAGDAAEPLDWAAVGALTQSIKQRDGVDVIPYSQSLDDGFYIETANASEPIPAQAFTDLAPLARGVQTVHLRQRALDDGVLQAVADLGHVRRLHLSECGLEADDLAPLTGMRRLRVLNLYGNPLGDDAVDTLVQVRSLRTLYVGGCGLSDEGLARLRESLPGCDVVADVPTAEAPTDAPAAEDAPKQDEPEEEEYVEPDAPAAEPAAAGADNAA